MSLPYTWITSYLSKVSKSQLKSGTFEPCFLMLEAISNLHNSATHWLLSTTYLLIYLAHNIQIYYSERHTKYKSRLSSWQFATFNVLAR